MLTPAHRVPVVLMLIVNQMETELSVSVGRGTREIHLSTVFSTPAPNPRVVSMLTAQLQVPGLCASADLTMKATHLFSAI